MSDKVQRAGRVEYIEPNSLFTESPGDTIQNGIPQPYEDYSFSVNLRVYNGNRYDCGMPDADNNSLKNIIEYSSDNGSISFMDGTSTDGGQGYLTTNFTDISMNDPQTNTKECLGIESITIKYNSWYTPTVDIKFIDVRGASLMQPAEYEYYNNGVANKGGKYNTSNSDFFKAFFSFPYPIFKLSVKGFYGKEVTYDLSVVKCNIEFNSSTGNFEITTNFVGYMYGMYADLPFSFIYLAPYIDLYGKNIWEEKRESKDFCYLTHDKEKPVGEKMFTFPELRTLVRNASQASQKESELTPEGEKYKMYEQLRNKLRNEVLPYYPTSTKNLSWWSWSKSHGSGDKKGYFFIISEKSPNTDRVIFNDFVTFAKSVYEYNTLVLTKDGYEDKKLGTKEIFDKIYLDSVNIVSNDASEIKTNVNGVTIRGGKALQAYTDDEIKSVLDGKIVTLSFTRDDSNKEKPTLLFNAKDSEFGSASESDFLDLINELKRRFNEASHDAPMHPTSSEKNWIIKAFEIDDIEYRKTIVTLLNDKILKEMDVLNKSLAKFREQRLTEAIKFDPTIKNLYNMVFAHMDTFMSVFYNTLERIRQSILSVDDDTRKKENLCYGNEISIDVNENSLKSKSSNGGKLPPFTMFFREKTLEDSKDKIVETIWPGELPNGKNLEEVKLVEAIINATSLNKRSFKSVTPKDNTPTMDGDLVPINYYDIVRGGGNPYLDVLKKEALSDTETLNRVLRIFVLRCYYSLLNGSYLKNENGNDGMTSETSNYTEKAKLIAELEVANVERAFKMIDESPSESFINKLLQISNDGSSLLSQYLSGDYPMFRDVAGGLEYTWIKYAGFSSTNPRYMLPVGNFDTALLDNCLKGANLSKEQDKFVQIGKDGTKQKNGHAFRIYRGGNYIDRTLTKHSSGDFVNAARLFPNFKKAPSSVENIKFLKTAFNGDAKNSDKYTFKVSRAVSEKDRYFKNGLRMPSYRRTSAGDVSIFMDPLYYAQTDVKARAYLFLLGIPFCDFMEKEIFLPEVTENGDYPTLMLLREGAVYWRNEMLVFSEDETQVSDPINYNFYVNGVLNNVLSDIETNCPNLGVKYPVTRLPKNLTDARKYTLIDYFLKWATGNENESIANIVASTGTKAYMPNPSMNFGEIENMFGLFTQSGEVKMILSDAIPSIAPTCAATVEYISGFANAAVLSEIYGRGSTNEKLGVLKGNIRTGVYINDIPSTETKMSENTEGFLRAFKNFYLSCDTVIDFGALDKPTSNYTVPRTAMNDALSAFIKGLKKKNNVSSDQLKKNTGTSSNGEALDEYKAPEYFNDTNLKLACYIALKNIYDRWLCSQKRDRWFFSCKPEVMSTKKNSDFNRFFYVNEFFHDIGMNVRPNVSSFVEMANKIGGFTEKSDEFELASKSVLQLLSYTAENARASLLTLPTMLGLAKTNTDRLNSIEDVFKAFPFNDAVKSDAIETSFIVLHTGQKSAFLDVENQDGTNAYKNDGFDIANTWGEIIPQPMFTNADEDDYIVPSFGVTFAKQNQSYFKNIRLSMADHQVTDYSLRTELMVSYANNRGPRENTVAGQDLYSVFSNYSYNCSVEMMGDAQITPLMYFQLNNVAMWKGAYMITSVEHTINSQGMNTIFTGVRMARHTVKYKDDEMINPGVSEGQTPYNQDSGPAVEISDNSKDISKRRLDLIDVNNVSSIVFVVNRSSIRESKKWINGLFSVRVYNLDGEEENIENIALTLEPEYALSKRIEDVTPEENRTIFSLPQGYYTSVRIEPPQTGREYRDPNDSFYDFTEGNHIFVTDSTWVGAKKAEIIPGPETYSVFESGGFDEISTGGLGPIMLFPDNGQDLAKDYDQAEIKAVYREIFDLVKRMNEAKKPLNLLIMANPNIENTLITE